MGKEGYLNVGESEEGKALTRRETRTSPLVCLEDACLTTGKARNMGTLAVALLRISAQRVDRLRLVRLTVVAVRTQRPIAPYSSERREPNNLSSIARMAVSFELCPVTYSLELVSSCGMLYQLPASW